MNFIELHLQNFWEAESKEKIQKIFLPTFFNELNKTKPKNIHNSQPLNQMATENIKIDNKGINRELVRKMNNPKYFTNNVMKGGFKFRQLLYYSYIF